MMDEARFEVLFAPDAEVDLASIGAFLAANGSPKIARNWLRKLRDAALKLEYFPARGSLPAELEGAPTRGYRQVVVRPYRIIYRIEGTTVVVAVVADARRDMRALLESRLFNR